MQALHLVASWPVDHVAAAVVTDTGVTCIGDAERSYRLASLAKPITTWAVLIAVEEGVVDLDTPLVHVAAPEGATMRHLLAHAAGFGFDGDEPVAAVERRRMYSNTGIERAADEVAAASGLEFTTYLTEAVLQPLGMTHTELRGSPAHAMWSTLDDMVQFVSEMRSPRLLAAETWADLASPQFPVSFPTWAVSIRAPGGSAWRSRGRNRHTGWVAPTRPRRSVTSAAPAR